MIRIPQRLRETTVRQKRAALILMAVLVSADQIWLRLITHYPVADPKHMVQIGVGQTNFYTGLPQASVHIFLLVACAISVVGVLLWRDPKRDLP